MRWFLCCLLVWLAVGRIAYIANVARHGARYPLTDIYDGKQSKQFHGQLTTVGLRQHYLLGSYLRDDYILKNKLINSTLYPKQVEIFADAAERCVESALAFNLGLFPFGTGFTIPEGINPDLLDPPYETFLKLREENFRSGEFALDKGYQPVPTFNASQFFPNCPNEDNILARRIEKMVKQLAQFQAEQAPFTQKMRLVFNLTNAQSNLAGLADLYDVIICDKYLGKDKFPSEFTQYDFQQLKFVQGYLFALVYGGEPAQVFGTSLVKAILNNMDTMTKGKDEVKKFSVYMGHDTNIVPLLMFFELTSPECLEMKWKNQTVKGVCAQAPPFAANMIFQLHEENNEFYVKIRYDGYYLKAYEGKEEWPYGKFADFCKSRFVDVEKECGMKDHQRDILVYDQI